MYLISLLWLILCSPGEPVPIFLIPVCLKYRTSARIDSDSDSFLLNDTFEENFLKYPESV